MTNVTYHFASLASLADFMGVKATQARERRASTTLQSKLNREEAAAWDAAADLVRKAVILPEKGKSNYRIRTIDALGNVEYLIREGGDVRLTSSGGVPMALANMAISDAMQLKFAAEDAQDGTTALRAITPLTRRKLELLVGPE